MLYLYAWLVAAATVSPTNAEGKLRLQDVVRRAREYAPAVLEARAVLGEAHGRLRGATPILPANPEVEGAVGRRSGHDERDLELGISQRIEIAGQRGLRVSAAKAAIDGSEASLELALREAAAEAAGRFYRVLHADERLALARSSEQVAAQLLEMAQKRYDAGDVAGIDLNLARIGLGRARATVAAAAADQTVRSAELRTAIGMAPDEALALDGSLRQRPAGMAPAIDAEVESRPETKAIAAELRRWEAEERLAGRAAWPEVGLASRYEREEGTPVVWGGVTVSLPLSKRGQDEKAAAGARAIRARAALGTTRAAVQTAIRSGFAAHRARLDAIAAVEQLVLPSVEDNENLSLRSFEVGEISMAELLVVRREGLEARAEYLDALLEAALIEVDLLARAGGLR